MKYMEYEKKVSGESKLYFPKDFFRGEFRCGFFVSSNMKKYWAAQLEILAEIDRICRKHNITYFADSGTLLGAVRHNGFIPWDDDLDIAMLREDYDKFAMICSGELDKKYLFAKAFQKTEFAQCFSRVYENNDIKMDDLSNECYFKNPHLAGVDIFPLDYIAPDKDEENVQSELIAAINELSHGVVRDNNDNTEGEIEKLLCKIEEIANVKIDRTKAIEAQLGELYDNLCKLYSGDEAKEVTTFPMPYLRPNWRFNKEWYDDTVLIDFEYFKLPCPIGYKDILTAGYGEYTNYERGDAMHAYPAYSKFKRGYIEEWESYLKKTLKKELSIFLNKSEERLEVVKMLKYDIRNTTMLFKIDEKEFTFRIPGNKIFNIANYEREKKIYDILKKYEITENVIYLSDNNGSKMTSMLQDTHPLNTTDKEAVLDFLQVLAFVHLLDVSDNVSFDIWEYIEKYEELWGDDSYRVDYEKTKKKIRECYDYTQSQPKAVGITHFDLSGENILVSTCENEEDDIRIIDWEFSGIQDTHIDLAVFALNSSYSREDVDWLIDSYFCGKCTKNTRTKIYCYMAVCALMFNNYYEYLDRNDEDMTQEQANYYNIGLEYYEIYCDMMKDC